MKVSPVWILAVGESHLGKSGVRSLASIRLSRLSLPPLSMAIAGLARMRRISVERK